MLSPWLGYNPINEAIKKLGLQPEMDQFDVSGLNPKPTGMAVGERVAIKFNDSRIPDGVKAGAPGAVGKNSSSQEQADTGGEKKAIFIDPKQYEALLKIAGQSPYVQEMERSATDLEKELARQEAAPMQVDFSPLADWANYATRGQYKSTYRPPESVNERREKLIALRDAIGRRRAEIANAVQDAARAMKIGETNAQTVIKVGSGADFEYGDPRRHENAAKEQKPFDPDAGVQKLGEKRAQAGASFFTSLKFIDNALKDQGGLRAAIDRARATGRASVPGTGFWSAISPTSWLTGEGSEIYRNAKDMAMARLNMRSGAAASEKEAARYLQQFGITPTSGPREFLFGMQKVLEETRAFLAAEEARFGAHPEVYKTYARQPGAILAAHLDPWISPLPTSSAKQNQQKAGSNAGAVAPRTRLTPEQEARRQELLRKKAAAEAAARGQK